MKTRPLRVYLDSNALIAYLADEKGRASVVESVLEDARNDKISLLTSVLSITEVAFISTGETGDVMDAETIDELWAVASPISVVDASARVALAARAIIRESKSLGVKVVKPADAIHLASASIHQCDHMFTYENKSTRRRWENIAHMRIA